MKLGPGYQRGSGLLLLQSLLDWDPDPILFFSHFSFNSNYKLLKLGSTFFTLDNIKVGGGGGG